MVVKGEYESKDGILVFNDSHDISRSSYESRLLQDQEEMESSHFWFRTRRDKICSLFKNHVKKKSKILEIGGGTGYIASKLMDLGFDIEMADIHFNGLRFAQSKGIKKLYQFDLYNPPFEEEFEVVCFFDVLEHQKDDQKALECIMKMLKPRGKIALTVPAHQWLWNRDDRINGHYRRYSKRNLQDLCRRSGLRVLRLEYFFTFIVPLLFLRALVNRDVNQDVAVDEKLKFQIPRIANFACYAMTKLEFVLSRWMPNVLGGSLFLLAEKID